jgi:hypothetical protein
MVEKPEKRCDMTHDMSRRAVVGGLGIAAGGVVNSAVGATLPETGAQLVVKGTVAWCHTARGLLSFHADPPGRDPMVVRLQVDAADRLRLQRQRPGMAVTVKLSWRPDLDILAPWAPQEVTCANGDRFVARLDMNEPATSRVPVA